MKKKIYIILILIIKLYSFFRSKQIPKSNYDNSFYIFLPTRNSRNMFFFRFPLTIQKKIKSDLTRSPIIIKHIMKMYVCLISACFVYTLERITITKQRVKIKNNKTNQTFKMKINLQM